MARESLNDLAAFVVVAREQSFTRAAALLGVSQSALSHTIRSLEARLGVRLLMRTTRNVSLTQIGETLLASVGLRIDEIHEQIESIGDLRDKPAGTIRISTTDYAINTLLLPKITPFLQQYPDIQVELIDDYSLTDIVAERYDAGIRLGEELQNGMISVRIGPDVRYAVVGSPAYFERSSTPLTPSDLVAHRCVNLRFSTHGGLHVWEFEKEGREMNVRVDGQITFSRIYQVLQAAVMGLGLAYVPEDIAEPYLHDGRLMRVLESWSPYWDGYYLYYPSRRQPLKAFTLLVEALRYNPGT